MTQTMVIERVLVQKDCDGAGHFVCEALVRGWRCGRCDRGRLKDIPKLGDKCGVCHSKVIRIDWRPYHAPGGEARYDRAHRGR